MNYLDNTWLICSPINSPLYFLVIHNMNTPMQGKYPQFIEVLNNYDLVFDKEDTKIYILRQ